MNVIDRITDHVRQFGGPEVVSLSDDTHVFHFDRQGDWATEPLLFVNRNGNQFRLIEQANGDYLFCKTWNGVLDHDAWMVQANLRREDPRKLIELCGTGPQGKAGSFEALCLLPRDTTLAQRKAVWRAHMMSARFDRAADTFTLILANGTHQTFKGKLWQSREASEWCAAHLGHLPLPYEKDVAIVKAGAARAVVEFELEDNPLWGAFG